LYIGGEKNGSVFKVKPVPEDVNDLRKAVKEEWPELNETAAARLIVYPAGTSVENLDKASSLRLSGPVPDATTEDYPLIVIAPPRELDERKPGKLITPFYAFMVALI
jgi:hypothetical protein